MRIPNKIQIIDTTQSQDSRVRFDAWEGYDTKMQIKHIILKINDILAYLHALPQIPDDVPIVLKKEGDVVVHQHEWIMHIKLGNMGHFECRVCGETKSELIPYGR